MQTFFKTWIFIFVFAIGCGTAHTGNNMGYNFKKPLLSFVLPDTLREISGLTIIDSTTFACVQDENGILFIYDLSRNKIKEQFTFHFDGDYEGITRVDSTIYVLRSDGTLFEISNYRSRDFKMVSYVTGIPANNNEGLCYDKDHNRLLIACKGKIGKGRDFKDKRMIYGFDLQKKVLSEDPVFEFDLIIIKEFAIENQLHVPVKLRKKKGQPYAEPMIKFRTSAIDIHPKTGELFLLSAADYMLFVFNSAGQIKHIEQLDSHVFNKAEGISFFGNGDMLITNEGQDKKPTLLKFKYRADF